MRLLTVIVNAFDRILQILPWLMSGILAFVWLSVCAEVIMRYLLHRPIFWVVEVSEYALGYITFLGAAWVLKKEKHARIDFVISRLNQGRQAFLEFSTSIVATIACLLLTAFGVRATWDTFLEGELRASLLTPPVWITLIVVPIGALLLTVQFIRRAQESHERWRSFASKSEALSAHDIGFRGA